MKLGTTSAIFYCETCGKSWEDYESSQRSAQEHTRRTGHPTRGEVATAFEYRRTTPTKKESHV